MLKNHKICGIEIAYFIPFFAVVMIALYGGFMPTVKIYSNDAGSYVATNYVATVAFLMAVGGLLFWLGNTIPILNNYLGGACMLPMLGCSFLNYIGVIPELMQNGVKVLMTGGFQDVYIALLLVGSILVMDRKIILGATARYMPTILGSQFFALAFCALGGLITRYGVVEALFDIGAPCMSGGSGGAIATIPALYTNLSGIDMTPMAGRYLCYVSISNVLAVVMAAVGGNITSKMKGLNGGGKILRKQGEEVTEGKERPASSTDYVALGSGIFMAMGMYLLGSIAGSMPGLSVIPGLAWTIIFVIIIKCTGIMPEKLENNCVYAMNFALKAMFPMVIAGIGINSLKFSALAEFFSIGAFIVIFMGVLGAMIGAMLFAKLSGLWPYEAGVTAGLCCCNIGGSGDLAVLSAANRMNLLAFASISTRIGGALMVIWIALLWPFFH